MEDTTTKCFFDSVFDADENEVKQEQKQLTRNRLERKLYSAYDSAAEKKMQAVESLASLRKKDKFETYDINSVITAKKTIAETQNLQAAIKAEYKDLFGKDMTPVEIG